MNLFHAFTSKHNSKSLVGTQPNNAMNYPYPVHAFGPREKCTAAYTLLKASNNVLGTAAVIHLFHGGIIPFVKNGSSVTLKNDSFAASGCS